MWLFLCPFGLHLHTGIHQTSRCRLIPERRFVIKACYLLDKRSWSVNQCNNAEPLLVSLLHVSYTRVNIPLFLLQGFFQCNFLDLFLRVQFMIFSCFLTTRSPLLHPRSTNLSLRPVNAASEVSWRTDSIMKEPR